MDFRWNIIEDWDNGANWTESGGFTSVFSTGSIRITGSGAPDQHLLTWDADLIQAGKKYVVYFNVIKAQGQTANERVGIDLGTGVEYYDLSGYTHIVQVSHAVVPKLELVFDLVSGNMDIEITDIQIRELETGEDFLINDGQFFDKFFGKYDKQYDSNKDGLQRGTFERYNLIVADDIDQQIVPLMYSLVEEVILRDTMFADFIPYWEETFGISVFNDETLRRKLLKQIVGINKIKGTPLSYKILFSYINAVANITELFAFSTFDSPTTLDSTTRPTFDKGKCNQFCTFYELDLVTSETLDAAYFATTMNIIRYLEPINAELSVLKFNGSGIEVVYITIQIDSNGDLQYENVLDPDLVITIDENGDLIINSPQASKYTLVNGDLFYEI